MIMEEQLFRNSKWIKDNLYKILQVKSDWISQLQSVKYLVKTSLYESYVNSYYPNLSVWNNMSIVDKELNLQAFNKNIALWLKSCYPHFERSLFTHTDGLIYDIKLYPSGPPKSKLVLPKGHRCEEDCIDNACPNRRRKIECDAKCKSGSSCNNKESQSNFDWEEHFTLQYIDERKGAGIFAKSSMPEGTYIGEVVGYAIPEEEYENRVNNQHSNKYMFGCAKTSNGSLRAVDPSTHGNFTRFINHSCSSNCGHFSWTSNQRSIIKMYSVEDIDAVSYAYIINLCLINYFF